MQASLHNNGALSEHVCLLYEVVKTRNRQMTSWHLLKQAATLCFTEKEASDVQMSFLLVLRSCKLARILRQSMSNT